MANYKINLEKQLRDEFLMKYKESQKQFVAQPIDQIEEEPENMTDDDEKASEKTAKRSDIKQMDAKLPFSAGPSEA